MSSLTFDTGIGATKTTLLTRTGTGKTPHTISNNVLNSQATGGPSHWLNAVYTRELSANWNAVKYV